MAEISQTEIDRRLNQNGWQWDLISTPTPGVVRIQLGPELDLPWRKCIEAPTPEQALNAAEEFVKSISASDYGRTQTAPENEPEDEW